MPVPTLWFATALLPQGWADAVAIDVVDGIIAAVRPGGAPGPGDERHAIGLPGLPNLHSHAFQRGMAGLAETRGPAHDSFWTWREIMYRFLDRLGPDEMEAIAEQAFAEMLESGFTRVGEFHYLHHDPAGAPYANLGEMGERIAEAAAAAGIALTLIPTFYAHSQFGGAPPVHGQRRFINDVERFSRLHENSRAAIAHLPDARLALAPHSLRAATPEEIAALLRFSSGPVHMHIAEQVKEVDDCLAWSGQRPVAWLLDHLPVDGRWCLVHATHMTPEEAAGLARSGAVAGLCPVTEANLGDGIFPAPAFREAGGGFGVGTDSNVLIDAAAELRQLEYAQRLGTLGRNVVPRREGESAGRVLFDAALAGGGAALDARSRIAEGDPADLVSLDALHPALAERSGDRLLDGWLFAARPGAVDCVWRRGEKLVAAGRHRDRDRIAGRYRAALRKVLA